MNPATLLEAMAQRGFLVGFAIAVVSGLASLVLRSRTLWMLGAAVAIVGALAIESPLAVDGFGERVASSSPILVIAALGVVVLASMGIEKLATDVGWRMASTCLALTSLGVWGTVPDTENAVILMGGTFGSVLMGWRLQGDRPPRGSSVPLLVLFALVAIADGAGRQSAPYGALATCGVFLLYPAVARYVGRAPDWMFISVHVVLVIFAGRVAGTRSTSGAAALFALVGLAAGAALLVSAARASPERPVIT